ncbi:MAG: tetratricopeptide repeat protein [Alphaproteobacteria bacterium]
MRSRLQCLAVRRGVPSLLLGVLLLAMSPAGAADEAAKPGAYQEWSGVSPEQYSECIDLALREPEAGFERAIGWRDMGGGAPARHCVTVALYALGHFAEAAKRLEELATEGGTLPVTLRTALLGQAGEAWMAARDYSRAYATLSAALEITPDDTTLLLERSLAAAGAESYFDALDDLNRVIDIAPDNADALAFRAAAFRYLDSLELANDDVERALEVDPSHAGALLERGNLRKVQGDAAGARKDWLKVISLAPESATADAARVNLEALDVKTQ